jgi:hypothetical protein
MPRFRNLLVAAALGSVTAAALAQSSVPDAISVDRNWQLFLDNYVIARATGFDRVLHHPRPMGIVIPADKPWETVQAVPDFVGRRSDGTYICIYNVLWWNPDAQWESKAQLDRAQQYEFGHAYATSRDGIHWEKPNLGLVEAPTGFDWEKSPPLPAPKGVSKENNLGVPFSIRDMRQYGNVQDPAKRFSISYQGTAYFAAEIPDFLHDPHWTDKLVPTGGTFSPRGATLDYWDDLHQEWVGIVQNVVPHWLPSREMARFASKDLMHWTSEIALAPDPEDPHLIECYDEPMDLQPFYSDGVVFGLLSWIHTDRINPDGGPVLQKTPEYPTIWPWARKGTVEMRITLSRDGGRTWDRTCSRTAWIPHGTEQDSYDRTLILPPCPPLRMGDEDWFYTTVWDGDHLTSRANAQQNTYYSDRARRGSIALYIQKHNRYVSLRAPVIRELPTDPEMRLAAGKLSASNPRPVLITKPLLLTGKTLELNVEANRGSVRVSIGSAEPVETLKGTTLSTAPHLAELHPLPGFSFDDCVPVHANSAENTVQFKNGQTLEALRGRPVRLLFEMVDADLYGFRVQ